MLPGFFKLHCSFVGGDTNKNAYLKNPDIPTKGGKEQASFFLEGHRRLSGGILYKPLLTYKLARHA
jgi:hypothetical protein